MRRLIVIVIPLTIAVFLYFAGFIGTSSMRVRTDHGLRLPSSASGLRCLGFVTLTPLLDTIASATFEIHKSEFVAIESQFTSPLNRVPETKEENRDDILMVPAEFVRRTQILRGINTSGNVVTFDLYELANSKTGVRITTFWN
jgi:hypothetical protein